MDAAAAVGPCSTITRHGPVGHHVSDRWADQALLAGRVLSGDVDQVRAALLGLVDDRAARVASPQQPAAHPAAGDLRLQAGDLQDAACLALLLLESPVERQLLRDLEHVDGLDRGIRSDQLCGARHRLVVDARAEDRHQRRVVGDLDEADGPLRARDPVLLLRVEPLAAPVQKVPRHPDDHPAGTDDPSLPGGGRRRRRTRPRSPSHPAPRSAEPACPSS